MAQTPGLFKYKWLNVWNHEWMRNSYVIISIKILREKAKPVRSQQFEVYRHIWQLPCSYLYMSCLICYTEYWVFCHAESGGMGSICPCQAGWGWKLFRDMKGQSGIASTFKGSRSSLGLLHFSLQAEPWPESGQDHNLRHSKWDFWREDQSLPKEREGANIEGLCIWTWHLKVIICSTPS